MPEQYRLGCQMLLNPNLDIIPAFQVIISELVFDMFETLGFDTLLGFQVA